MFLLKRIEKTADGFLKKYDLHYDADGTPVRWEIVTPNDLHSPEDLAGTLSGVEIIARFPDGDLLLCREYRYAVGGWYWELPTGMIEPGETPEQAASRELQEETGLNVIQVDRVLQPDGYCVGISDEIMVPVFLTVADPAADPAAGQAEGFRLIHVKNDPPEQILTYRMSRKDLCRLMQDPDSRMTHSCQMYLAGMLCGL